MTPTPSYAARRAGYFAASALTAAAGTAAMAVNLAPLGLGGAAAVALAALCLWWISLGLWSAVIGFALTLRAPLPASVPPAPAAQRTAILVPVYNEDCDEVFAGVRATYESLARTGRLDQFDVFVLSDSTDPAIRHAETAAWEAACRDLDAGGRLFYRHRDDNRGRKAGNIADWVRRWGGAYEAFVILDADSIMSGACLAALADRLAAAPRAAIIQTLPLAVGQRSIFGRAVQFSHRLAGPLLARGQAWWQGPDSNYFGHNAIVRTRAFAAHCGLPTLDGAPPSGGDILSHDFIEAACLRRAGWTIHAAPDLPGSYERTPENLIDYAIRDRRWIQGNLQHLALVGARGFAPMSRFHILTGILAYAMSPLWLALLLIATPILSTDDGAGGGALPALALAAPVLAMLALPRVLGAIALRRRYPKARRGRLVRDVAGELALSALLAPTLMLLHSYFIAANFAGRAVDWRPQRRTAHGLAWTEAFARCAACTIAGTVWGGVVFATAPTAGLYLLPVLAGLGLAVPLAVWTSRTPAKPDFLPIPEDIAPPAEIAAFERARASAAEGDRAAAVPGGAMAAVARSA